MERIVRIAATGLTAAGLIVSGGCSTRVDDAGRSVWTEKRYPPVSYKKKGSAQRAVPAVVVPPSMLQKASDNTAFFIAVDRQLSDANRALDALVRPVLREVFEAAKAVSEDEKLADYVDCIHNISYSLRRVPDARDCERLYAAFVARHFTPRPRVGMKAGIENGRCSMSFFPPNEKAAYSVVIDVDLNNCIAQVKTFPD